MTFEQPDKQSITVRLPFPAPPGHQITVMAEDKPVIIESTDGWDINVEGEGVVFTREQPAAPKVGWFKMLCKRLNNLMY